jgi:hypothetical protein
MKSPSPASLRLLGIAGALLVGLLLSASTPAAQASPDQGVPEGMLTVAPGASARQVKEAIVMALQGRHWTVESADGSSVVGFLKHRDYEATLTFQYDANTITITSDSYRVDGSGRHVEEAIPSRWIKYLKKDIPRFLAKRMAAKS